MNDNYSLTTKKSWSQTEQELAYSFEKWGITEWDTNYPKGARLTGMNQTLPDRTVRLTYIKNGKTINLEMGKQGRAVDNLRVLYLTIEAMRLNEKRGIAEVMQSAYLQLDTPKQKRNPYEVLGINPDSELAIAEAVYRTLASKYHPDSIPDGNTDKFRELAEAIEEIRKEKQ